MPIMHRIGDSGLTTLRALLERGQHRRRFPRRRFASIRLSSWLRRARSDSFTPRSDVILQPNLSPTSVVKTSSQPSEPTGIQAAGDEGRGPAQLPSVRPPGPPLSEGAGIEPARSPWEQESGRGLLASRDAGLQPAPRLPRSRCRPSSLAVPSPCPRRALPCGNSRLVTVSHGIRSSHDHPDLRSGFAGSSWFPS